MDEDSDNSTDIMTAAASFPSRHRSPSFSKREIKSLLNLIQKYKRIICNKSTTSAVNQAKDRAWMKITKSYNDLGFEHNRTLDSLKMKFENLKKEAKKVSKNVSYDKECHQVTKHLILQYESNANADLNVNEELNDNNESDLHKKSTTTDSVVQNDNDDKSYSDNSLDEPHDKDSRSIHRSMNFSSDECNLLLQCVRQEKKNVFNDGKSSDSYRIRDRAWTRIANCFNKQSPRKRSSKVLRTKFANMKRFAKNMQFTDIIKTNKGHKKLIEENYSDIKTEPIMYDEPDEASVEIDPPPAVLQPPNAHARVPDDPLSFVLNGDCNIDSVIPSENKEVVKLKLELLNYELETAKLQRRRVEMLIEAEAAERSSRALETALRLRAARLSAVAAAATLPPGHPALALPPQEAPAQHYLDNYPHT